MVCRNDEGSFFLFFQNGAWRPGVCVCVCARVCVCVRQLAPLILIHSADLSQDQGRPLAGHARCRHTRGSPPTAVRLPGETSLVAELGWSGRP